MKCHGSSRDSSAALYTLNRSASLGPRCLVDFINEKFWLKVDSIYLCEASIILHGQIVVEVLIPVPIDTAKKEEVIFIILALCV